MNTRDLQRLSVEELVHGYEAAASSHGAASAAHNPRAANKAYRLVSLFSKEFRRRGLEAQKALLPLLKDRDLEVVVCAARDVLEFSPYEAEDALKKVIEAKVDCSIHAYLILDEWKSGRLKFS